MEAEFLSQAALEDMFEQDRRFDEETPEQTLGRLGWLMTRSQAEMVLLMRKRNAPKELAIMMLEGYRTMQEDYFDMILMGLGINETFRDMEVPQHPMRGVIDELLDDFVESYPVPEGVFGELELMSNLAEACTSVYDLGIQGDEDLIKDLSAAVTEW